MLLTKLLWFAFGRQALIRATQGLAINHSWSILIVAPPQWWFFNSVQHILHACMHIPNMYCPLLSCTHIHPPIESIVLSCMEIHILYMHKDRLTCMYTKIPFRSIAFPVLAMQSWKSCWRQWLPTLLAASSCELSEKTLCFYKMPGKSSKGTFKGVIIVTYLNLIFELVRDMRLTCQHVLGQAFKTSEEALWADCKGSFEICQDVRMFTFSLNSIHDIFCAPPNRHDEMQKNVLRKWVERAWDSYAFARFCHLHCSDHWVTCVPWTQTRPVFKECLKTWNEILI